MARYYFSVFLNIVFVETISILVFYHYYPFSQSRLTNFLIEKSKIDNVCILKQLTICFSNNGKNVIIFVFMWKTAIQKEFVVYLFGRYELLNVGRKSLNCMCHHRLSYMFYMFYQVSINTQYSVELVQFTNKITLFF